MHVHIHVCTCLIDTTLHRETKNDLLSKMVYSDLDKSTYLYVVHILYSTIII